MTPRRLTLQFTICATIAVAVAGVLLITLGVVATEVHPALLALVGFALIAALTGIASVFIRRITRDGSTATLYHDIFHTRNDAVILHAPDTGEVLEANDRVLEMFRATREDIIGSTLADLLAPSDHDHADDLKSHLTQAINDGHAEFEWRATRRDGESFWVQVTLHTRTIDDQSRIVTTLVDLTKRKRTEDAFRTLGEETSGVYGIEFCEAIVGHLASIIDADYVVIAERVAPDSPIARTMAMQGPDGPLENFEYELAGTPCEHVIAGATSSYPSLATERFPDDEILRDLEVEGYIGHPLFDSQRRQLGLIAAMFRQPVTDLQFKEMIIRGVGARVASELERTRADEALRQRNSDLRRAQTIAQIGSYVWDVKNDKLSWSDELKRIYGREDAPESIALARAIVHEDDIEEMKDKARRARELGEPFDVEYRVVRPDGTIRHVHDVAQLVRDGQGTLTSIFGTVQDITERYEAEQALRASESKYRDLYDRDPVMRVSVDAQTGAIVDCNQTACLELGFPRDELVGRSVMDVYHEESREGARRAFETFRATGSVRGAELQLQRKDGSIIDVSLNVSAIRDDQGRIVQSRSTWTDITARKEALAALEASEERYRLVFNQQFQFMAVLDPEGRIIDINDLPCRALGRSRADLIGQLFWNTPGWEDLEGWPSIIRGRIEQARESEGPVLADDLFRVANGETRHATAVYTAVRDADGNVRFIIVQATDITDRIRAEHELQRQAETQKLLLSELDHRVRNNISSLLALIELSRASATSIDELAASMSSRARAIASVHSVLSSSKWSGGDLERMVHTIVQPITQTHLTVSGPHVVVPLTQAQALGLIINELAANSMKYGSMSVADGRLEITWDATPLDDGRLQVTLRWEESDGPPIVSPPTPGSGSYLLERLAASELQGEARLSFPEAGVRHTIDVCLGEAATAQFNQLSDERPASVS